MDATNAPSEVTPRSDSMSAANAIAPEGPVSVTTTVGNCMLCIHCEDSRGTVPEMESGWTTFT